MKKYFFNFVDGGWNHVFATSKKKAIKLAKENYNDILVVDEKSFRIATEKEEKYLMSLFY